MAFWRRVVTIDLDMGHQPSPQLRSLKESSADSERVMGIMIAPKEFILEFVM